jgi:hypothetical protein
MNIYNDLQIKSKQVLDKDYDDTNTKSNTTNLPIPYNPETCIYSNYTLLLNKPDITTYKHHRTTLTTKIIPNIIDKYSFEDDKGEYKNFLAEYIESILYTLIPILAIIFTIILITRCRKIRMKRVRPIVSLAQLKQSTQNYNTIDLNSSIDSSTAIINSIV